MSYQDMPLAAQFDIATAETFNASVLNAKAQVYTEATTQLYEAGRSVGEATDRIEPAWTDAAGEGFVLRARGGRRQLDTWAHTIESANPQAALLAVVEQILVAHPKVAANKARADDLAAAVYPDEASAAAASMEILRLQREAGATLDELGRRYTAAGAAVQAATAGADWTQEITDPGGGGAPAATGAPNGGGTADAAAGSANAAPGAGIDASGVDTTGGVGAGAETAVAGGGAGAGGAGEAGAAGAGGAGGGGGVPGADAAAGGGFRATAPGGAGLAGIDPNGIDTTGGLAPSLAGGLAGGGGVAPTLPQAGGFTVGGVSAGGTLLPPIVPPVGGLTPAQSAAISAARAGGYTALSPGGGGSAALGGGFSAGGAGVPGLSLGGATRLPIAAAPLPTGGVPGTGTAPTGPFTASASGVGSGGGVPPMVPPAAAGAGTGRTGTSPIPPGNRTAQPATTSPAGGYPPISPPPGTATGTSAIPTAATARPPHRSRPRRDERPPGLSAVLSGRTATPDRFALPPARTRRKPDEEPPPTIEFVDEDLWKVDEDAPVQVVAPTPVHRH